jgi:hypothetical protein
VEGDWKAVNGTWLLALLLSCLVSLADSKADYAGRIASLIDPAKLSTLGSRGANPRVQKVVFCLAMAERDKFTPAVVLELALRSTTTNRLAKELTSAALLRNLKIARELGCLDYAGLSEMRLGKAPTIRNGPYAGDQLSVDYIIPRKVCKELDNVIANLELMPERINSAKKDRVGVRQVALAKMLNRAGLLSVEGLKKVEGAEKR